MKKIWLFVFAFSALIAGLAAYAAATLMLQSLPPAAHGAAPRQVFVPLYPQEAAKIAPQRALYKIELVQRNSAAHVLNISGQMYFEWRAVCNAWETKHRFNILYDYADAPQLRVTSDFTTYEPMDGKSFDFYSRRRRNGDLYESFHGHATMPAQNEPGEAVFTEPEGLDFTLPAGTLFSAAQTLAVLQAAREGRRFYNVTLFDGSDQEGPNEVNTFIGKPVDLAPVLAAAPAAVDKTLLASPARRVHLAFFPLSSVGPDSEYEMDMTLHENGLVSAVRVDYKDFTIVQKLVALSPLPREGCAGTLKTKAGAPGAKPPEIH